MKPGDTTVFQMDTDYTPKGVSIGSLRQHFETNLKNHPDHTNARLFRVDEREETPYADNQVQLMWEGYKLTSPFDGRVDFVSHVQLGEDAEDLVVYVETDVYVGNVFMLRHLPTRTTVFQVGADLGIMPVKRRAVI